MSGGLLMNLLSEYFQLVPDQHEFINPNNNPQKHSHTDTEQAHL